MNVQVTSNNRVELCALPDDALSEIGPDDDFFYPSPPRRLWMVGRHIGTSVYGGVWDFQGVFESEARAVAACRDETYFVAPVTLDEELPHETYVNPGAYYPLAIEETA